jgi:hypothetical protein
MINFHDIEQLSAYLDGQLNRSDSARLESRISLEPEFASVLNDIRAARGILRKLPARKAPRNFRLTRKMVGLRPPLPQSYSFFRFSTAVATVILLITFAANTFVPRISFGAAAPVAQEAYGFGGGGGGCEQPGPCPPASVLATEAPAATEAPSRELAAAPTQTLPSENADSTRISETPATEAPMLKEAETESAPQDPFQVQRDAVVPMIWQIILLIIGLVCGLIAFGMSQNAKKKWS